MKYIKRLFQGRINRQTYLLGLLVNLFIIFIVELPIIVFLFERFTRPTYIPMTTTYIIMPVALFFIICIQIIYYFSLDIRRKHDINADNNSNELFLWDFFIKKGEKKENKYGKPPKDKIDIYSLFLGNKGT